MIRLIRADLVRLVKSRAFRLSLAGMLALSTAFMVMQATAIDYSVPLSRVIFLPMSMYGVAAAALVSVFAGDDFSGGFIRMKLLAVRRRSSYVLSQIFVSCTSCAVLYSAATVFTAGIGRFFFENNVRASDLIRFYLLGVSMSLASGALFAVITLLLGEKTKAVVVCMASAFGMLFLAMHTNSLLVQERYKDGVLNPKYVGGIRRMVYGILHDLNPCGQAAQLSTWEVPNPLRVLLFNLLLAAFLTALCCRLFERKNIN